MQEESIETYLNQVEVPVAAHHPAMSEEFISIYKEALRLSKLEVDRHIKFRNVQIYEKQHIHEVYTVGDKKLPHLVLLHGYGGTSLTYIRCFQYLKDRFQMHALDTFGVGLSSIGTWKDEHSAEEAANYYIDALQQWRKSVGLSQIILAGHSFGGYISTLYYQKYPNAVKQLILLSPAGSSQFSEQRIKERQKNSRFFFCVAQKIYNMNIRPFKIMNTWWIGNKFIERLLTNRLKVPQQQQTIWKKYLKYVAAIENNSEKGFYTLFGWPLQPMKSIQNIVKTLRPKIKIDILFGDNDWMQKSGAYRLQEELPQQVTVHTVVNSGHQILFDNPVELTNKIKEIAK